MTLSKPETAQIMRARIRQRFGDDDLPLEFERWSDDDVFDFVNGQIPRRFAKTPGGRPSISVETHDEN